MLKRFWYDKKHSDFYFRLNKASRGESANRSEYTLFRSRPSAWKVKKMVDKYWVRIYSTSYIFIIRLCKTQEQNSHKYRQNIYLILFNWKWLALVCHKYSQTNLHLHVVWQGSILLANNVLILISLKKNNGQFQKWKVDNSI